MSEISIKENIKTLRQTLPAHVTLAAAAKTRSVDAVREALETGVTIIGQNYVHEGEMIRDALGRTVRMHFIGHLQRNKVKRAVGIFDLIETVDSLRLAEEIDKRCAAIDKVMPVLIEVNSGLEAQKFGVMPRDLDALVEEIARFSHVCVQGLMTMGPYTADPEDARPYFEKTKRCFDRLAELRVPLTEMKWLSMGMTHSYQVAVEEGANLVRIGTGIFGARVIEK